MLNKITLQQHHDKWFLHVGRVSPAERQQLVEWCVQMWGSHWGEVDTHLAQSVFIFHKLAHANWFMLKWA